MNEIKRILNRQPEPLLIIIPLLLLVIEKLFITSSPPPVDGFFQLDASLLFLMAFALVMVPLLLHFLLKVSGKWQVRYCRPHVYLTAALMLLLFTAFYSVTPPETQWFRMPAEQRTMRFFSGSNFGRLFLLALLVQLAFTVYFLRAIFKRTAATAPGK